MSVIPITIFFSLLLAGGFAALFAREQRRRRFASAERDSLLPLADETPKVERDLRARSERSQLARHSLGDGGRPRSTHEVPDDHSHDDDHAHDDGHDHEHAHGHQHAHGKGGCGCKSGERPPCAGCLRRTGATPLQSPSPLH